MDTRYWFDLDRYLNPAGFGCWQLAGRHFADGKANGWHDITTADAIGLVHLALDRGIRFFDTAAGYGDGRSEMLVGAALATSPCGHDALVCTKIPLTQDEETMHRTAADFELRVDRSLQRLRRDHIDILLLHNPGDKIDWRRFDSRIFDDLKARGKILSYGVSCRSLDGVYAILNGTFGSCIEWVFNIFERRPATQIFPRLAERRINFIARSPLSHGLVAPRSSENGKALFDAEEFRSTLPQEWVAWTVASVQALEALTRSPGGLIEFALRYCLSYDQVSSVIPGMHKPHHINALLDAAAKGRLSDQTLAHLDDAIEAYYPAWA